MYFCSFKIPVLLTVPAARLPALLNVLTAVDKNKFQIFL